jgi:hypothetical protein
MMTNFSLLSLYSQNRLASLYPNFSAQQTLNPSGYVANLSVWKKALFHACRKGKVPFVVAADRQAVKRREILHDEDGAAATDYLSFSTGEALARALELRPYRTGRSGQGCSREARASTTGCIFTPGRKHIQQEVDTNAMEGGEMESKVTGLGYTGWSAA